MAAQVAKRLLAAEMAVDIAIGETARLLEALALASREAGMPPDSGPQAPTLVSQALTNLAGARGEIVGAHKALDGLARRLSLPVSAFGVPIKPREAAVD